MLQVLVALFASFLTFDCRGSELGKKIVEMRGIDPRTSRMLSERSTIWATSASHCSNTPSEKFNRTLTSPKSRSFLYYSLEAWARPNQSSRIRSQISQQNAETSTATIRVSNFHYFSSFDFYRMFVFLLIVQSPKQFFRRTLRGQCKPLHPRPPYFLHGF